MEDFSEQLKIALAQTQAAKYIRRDPKLLEELERLTGNSSLSVPQRVWLLKNGFAAPPSCPHGSERKWIDGSVGYRFCGRATSCECARLNHSTKISSAKRAMTDEQISEANLRRMRTVQNKYGVEHISQEPCFRKKVEQTCLVRYGEKTNLTNTENRRKVSKTNLERYGHEVASQNSEVAKKISETHRSNGGTFFVDRERYAERMRELHGVEHALQKKEFLDKRDQTTAAKWGSSNHMLNPEVADRARATSLAKYGAPHSKQVGYSESDLRLVSDIEFFVQEYAKLGIDGILEKYSISKAVVRNLLVESGIDYDKNLTSSEEIVFNILSSFGLDITVRSRSIIPPLEVDFYVEKAKIAVEVCGLYWHSEGRGKKRSYHLEKLKRCESVGVRLITIFDDELKNVDLLRRKLRHLFLNSERLCHARQTEIREISIEDARQFLEDNHIQGYCRSRIKLGAFHSNTLVAVMTFGPKRAALGSKSSPKKWELLRMASSSLVPGISSKLFTYFVRNYLPEEVISYCDRRWGTGAVYEKMGMKFSHNSAPGYWYLDSSFMRRLHRFAFTKQKLVEAGYDKALSESQIMVGRSYDKIWDCGNSVWIWTEVKTI